MRDLNKVDAGFVHHNDMDHQIYRNMNIFIIL